MRRKVLEKAIYSTMQFSYHHLSANKSAGYRRIRNFGKVKIYS